MKQQKYTAVAINGHWTMDQSFASKEEAEKFAREQNALANQKSSNLQNIGLGLPVYFEVKD